MIGGVPGTIGPVPAGTKVGVADALPCSAGHSLGTAVETSGLCRWAAADREPGPVVVRLSPAAVVGRMRCTLEKTAPGAVLTVRSLWADASTRHARPH